MSDDKQPMQASGAGTDRKAPDGVKDAPGGAGSNDSYPNPHTGKKPKGGGFMGHGGQTEIDYHGPGQLGDEAVDSRENPNAATKND